MPDEKPKCILDPYRDCLGLEKARQLEKQLDRHLSESNQTHQDLMKRLEKLENLDARRDEREDHMIGQLESIGDSISGLGSRMSNIEKLTGLVNDVKDLNRRVTDLEMKPARKWEKVAGGIVAAVALAMVGFFLGQLGLSL